MNILFVGAHHDDLELSIGGSVKRWVAEGHKVFCATLTNSTWKGPDGINFRDVEKVKEYCRNASKILGYEPINLCYSSCFELNYSDDKVVDILNIINKYDIKMIVTIWPYDAHRDHRVAAEIALAATRTVPRVLMTRLSWNSTSKVFDPRYFVDIEETFEDKKRALSCYEDEYERRGREWEKYIKSQGQLFGLEANCELAEGFEVLKYLH